ncbi:unnamed protein product [Orchesella dallaii]|uniref:Uncharacterized protein n=1 Tax=Orchesella dallaii TaxID=48710 RepID=A0ABP1RUD3_9HEXA
MLCVCPVSPSSVIMTGERILHCPCHHHHHHSIWWPSLPVCSLPSVLFQCQSVNAQSEPIAESHPAKCRDVSRSRDGAKGQGRGSRGMRSIVSTIWVSASLLA